MKEESSDLTRTQVIEFYRSNMETNFQDKGNDQSNRLTINKLII